MKSKSGTCRTICLLLRSKWPSWNGVRGHWRFKSNTSLKSRSRSKFWGFADDVIGRSESPRSRARWKWCMRSIMKQLKPVLIWGTTVNLQFWLYVAELRTHIIFHFSFNIWWTSSLFPFGKLARIKFYKEFWKSTEVKRSDHFFQLHVARGHIYHRAQREF